MGSILTAADAGTNHLLRVSRKFRRQPPLNELAGGGRRRIRQPGCLVTLRHSDGA
jgi:hypothetical protein